MRRSLQLFDEIHRKKEKEIRKRVIENVGIYLFTSQDVIGIDQGSSARLAPISKHDRHVRVGPSLSQSA